MINDGNKKSLIPQAQFKTGLETGGLRTGSTHSMPRVLGSDAATEGGGRIVVSQTKTPTSWRREFPETAGVVPPHPFKITITEGDIFVQWGMVTGMIWVDDTAVKLRAKELVATINGGGLKNNPLGTSAGSIALSSTCGVWCKVEWSSFFSSLVPWFAAGIGDNQSHASYPTSAEIIIDTTYSNHDDGPNIPQAANETYYYLGKITVAGSNITIQQWRKSDLLLHGNIVTDLIGA